MCPLDDGTTWRIEIERAHMEEDTGKLTHLGSDTGRIAGRDHLAARLQPRGRAADRDRHQAHRGRRRAGPGDRPRVRHRAAGSAARLGRFRCPDGPGLDALRLQRVAEAEGRRRSSVPAPRPRTSTRSRASRWRCATRCAGRRRFCEAGGAITAGDPPFPRGRLHHGGPQQGDRAGLPVLPRARPGTGGAQRRDSSSNCGRRFPSFRGCRASGFSRSGGSPTR